MTIIYLYIYLDIFSFLSIVLCIFLSLFIYFERQSKREHTCMWAWEGVKREREKENGRERIHTVSTGPNVGFDLMNCEIMTWAEIKSWMFNSLSHPGTPLITHLAHPPTSPQQPVCSLHLRVSCGLPLSVIILFYFSFPSPMLICFVS